MYNLKKAKIVLGVILLIPILGVAQSSPRQLEYEVPKELQVDYTISNIILAEVSKGATDTDEWLLQEIEKSESESKEQVRIFDIALSEDLQRFAYDKAKQYNIEYELFLSLLWVESGGQFKSDLISATNDYGLAQVNKINHKWLAEAGLPNMLDPYQSIEAGAIILGGLVQKYGNSHEALMAYNFGEDGAKRHWKQGTYSSKYSRRVFEIKNTIFN